MFEDIIGEKDKPKKRKKLKKAKYRTSLISKDQVIGVKKGKRKNDLMKKAMRIRKDLSDIYDDGKCDPA